MAGEIEGGEEWTFGVGSRGAGGCVRAVFEGVQFEHKNGFLGRLWNGGERGREKFAGKILILIVKIYFEVLNWLGHPVSSRFMPLSPGIVVSTRFHRALCR